MRAELRSLPDAVAERVARLLVAVAETMDDDPAAAVEFAQAAKASAARLAVVREALGLAAYANGDYALALAELRAVRRMTGANDHLAILADCERGLDRPQRALDLLAEVSEADLGDEARIEARIVAAGARTDLGQPDAAILTLQLPALTSPDNDPWLLRLRYAYAEALVAADRPAEALDWFRRIAEADHDGVTDAAERLNETGSSDPA